MDDFSELSKELTKLLSKEEKKKDGIFFTPPITIKELANSTIEYFKKLNPNFSTNQRLNILEPSCGSCEIINYLTSLKSKVKSNITGIEYNKKIFQEIEKTYKKGDRVNLFNADYLKKEDLAKQDIIIGNPPYYVMKKKDIDSKYYKYMEGRPNIFCLFIIKSLELLNTNSIMSFILPASFLNCLYYNNLRRYIYNNFQILEIKHNDDTYLDTQQPTISFILAKLADADKPGINNEEYVIKFKNNEIITFNSKKNISKLKLLKRNSKSLTDYNFKASIGSVVWNQVKKDLTDNTEKTKLIYSSNIKNGELINFDFKNNEKKQYINRNGLTETGFVLNRGYGKGSYSFNYAIIDVDYPYLIENHLIFIRYEGESDKLEMYRKLSESFKKKETLQFVELFFTNNAININELNNILPIWLE